MPSDIFSWQSDGRRLHAIPCGSVAGPDNGGLTAGELPDGPEIDAARQAMERRYADHHTTGDRTICTNPGCRRCGGLTEQLVRRAVNIPTARLLRAVKEVGPDD